ncbi:hypothetical protein [Mycolicibacterium diernhoferi]|uniref:Uncharacterized protein n=1 Tax=Mycolicibacterium diernhoferi TaxID=1801 RepID=A0A1Q4HL25_9MYCO|nr:hypothetical protein [Mycolicibacterium diernhoferi]OJZ68185.1 hypothetical protein BRW64_00895 [Mycolicibacterium diernhoferi]OPE55749.1 hypothetical protein BV510_03385 [Mycolicibacterium diernhoferi]PEG56255.1 hypothetical protein CRI78_02490 [Mycolicibacterium diernhoferi]QYL21327.1 hypothetical protein K0O62_20175 [Mycolicibacterium diernhoferi]
MTQGNAWTREHRENALAAISVVRELLGGGHDYGSEDAATETFEVMAQFDDVETEGEALARLMTGLGNVAAMLARRLEQADGVEWTQTLRDLERIVKEQPLAD